MKHKLLCAVLSGIFLPFLLSGCGRMPLSVFEEKGEAAIEGMQIVECTTADVCDKKFRVQIQIPEEWKMELYDRELPYRDPWTSTYVLYMPDKDSSAWITGGEVILYAYADIMKQTSDNVEEDYLYTNAETKEWMEEQEDILTISETAEEYEGEYGTLLLDYTTQDQRYREKYISNDEENADYFQAVLCMHMNHVDEETAQIILDSMKMKN